MFRSVKSIVRPPANTGRDRRRRIVVSIIDQVNRGIRSYSMPSGRMLCAVEIKLIDARIEDAPAKWREKMAKSTEGPLW